MAQIEVTGESLRTAVDEAVFAQAVTLADKVAGSSAGTRYTRGAVQRRYTAGRSSVVRCLKPPRALACRACLRCPPGRTSGTASCRSSW